MNFLLVAALAFYGISFDPATTNEPSASRIVPVNAVAYRMVQPDGAIRVFTKDSSRPGVILGDRPWLGTVKDNVIRVWADPASTDGRLRTQFVFLDGQLRQLFLDGTMYFFPSGQPKLDGSLASLWPERKARSYQKGSSADIWLNDARLKLWFANPNSAGMLCAQVALLGLWLLLGGHWFRRLPGLVILVGSFWGVAQSGSRSSLLAFVVGAGLMMVFSLRRHLNVKSIGMAILAVCVVVGAIAASGMAKRFTDTLHHVDEGNLRRLSIGKAAVKMFADAPLGWHCGEVPGRNAALNFYVFDDNHVIRTHLLSMAELGWPVGFGYAFFWSLMLTVGFACAKRGDSLSVGEWVAFSLAGLFNPVYTEVSLWAVPVAATAWSGWCVRKAMTRRLLCICGIVSSCAAIMVVIALVVSGTALNAGRRTSVHASGKAAVLNGQSPSVWIVEDQPVLGGWGFPGRELLAYYAQQPDAPAIGYVWDIHNLPCEVEKLVLPGKAAAEYLDACRTGRESVCRAKKTVFLSPSVEPAQMDANVVKGSKVLWIAGTFALDRSCERPMQKEKWLAVVPGVELYVPNWQKIIFAW